ncbi:uridine-cytidine kinase C isoform X2 [Selaginella moellendorffii]|uniref:uridine-cytidine kinase C isoform X2 n=1 Tax=Selaginella moellendorffii TaxID=88036 RepID=UPI000D1C3069|nr:uridine-cytidine kinase C isoform X2 [Selaginella moellendorffii]|eukprot:XP_024533969.1 uridine-cytidine kinase C isoform X2 [Selaginella moellendorffii]
MESSMRKLLPSPHRRTGLLKDQLQLVPRKGDGGREDRYEIAPISDPLSFDKGFFLFIRACQLLTRKMEGVTIVVGVAGPSGAGKTVFTDKVASFLPGIAIICMDNYNDSSLVIDGNYDDPRIVDYEILLDNIKSLRAGNSADIPIYDFKLSRRVGYRRLEHPSTRIVIVEGIYALCEKLRPFLDLRVSITGGVHFDLVKRVLRDINRSGQAPEDIIHQISETVILYVLVNSSGFIILSFSSLCCFSHLTLCRCQVYPMYKVFIEPDLATAHIKVVNKFNPFLGFQSPTYILTSSRHVTEEEIKAAIGSKFTEATEDTYDIYLLPPGEDLETCQSYLRMRNRDGRYSLIFEELVTDEDFIISPRITFDVSVRLLGGLMALGYEMATIMKRSSRVFCDETEKIVVKIDKLEQVQRKYVQIQGKDRSLVADIGKKLGLEGSYIPRSYIEQIQLEKLTAEVVALPEDLKNKLSLQTTTVPESPVSSKTYSRSLSWNTSRVKCLIRWCRPTVSTRATG